MIARKLFVVLIVISMMSTGIVIFPSNVKAVESSSLEMDLYPTTAEMVNEYAYSVQSYTVGTGASTYEWFRPIYLNDTGYSCKFISLETHTVTPEQLAGGAGTDGRLTMYFRNDLTTTTYAIGQYYTSTSGTLYVLDGRVNINSVYGTAGSPNHFSFGFRLQNTGAGSRTITLRFYHVTAHLTFERTEAGGSSTTVLNAIAGMNASMQVRFNAVDNKQTSILTRINQVSAITNNTYSAVKSSWAKVNNTYDRVGFVNTNVTKIYNKILTMDTNLTNVYNRQTTIMTKLNNIATNVSFCNATVLKTYNVIKMVSTNLTSLSTKVIAMNSTVNSISSRVNSMNTNIQNLLNKTRQDIVNHEANSTTRFNQIKSNLTNIRNDIAYTNSLMNLSMVSVLSRFNQVDSELNALFKADNEWFNKTYKRVYNESLNLSAGIYSVKQDLLNSTNSILTNILYSLSCMSNNATNATAFIVNRVVENITYTRDYISNIVNVTNSRLINVQDKIDNLSVNVSIGDKIILNGVNSSISTSMSYLSNNQNWTNFYVNAVGFSVANTSISEANRIISSMSSNITSVFNNLTLQNNESKALLVGAIYSIHQMESNDTINKNAIIDEIKVSMVGLNASNNYTYAQLSVLYDSLNNLSGNLTNNTWYIVNSVVGNMTDNMNNLTTYLDNQFDIVNASFVANDINILYYYNKIKNDVGNLSVQMSNEHDDYHNWLIQNLTESFGELIYNIGVKFNTSYNYSTNILYNFNGTNEQFNYTWNIINNTREMIYGINVTMDGYYNSLIDTQFDVFYDTMANFTLYESQIQSEMFDYYTELNRTHFEIMSDMSNYYITLDQVSSDISNILYLLEESKVVSDDGLTYRLKSADANVNIKYEFVKERWINSDSYYRYTVTAKNGSQLSKLDIEVDYSGKDLEGFWRDVVIIGVNSTKEYVIPIGNYYVLDGSLIIDTLDLKYDSFIIHVSPTVVTRFGLYWNNYWNR